MFNLLIYFFLLVFSFNSLHAETILKNCIYKWQTGEKRLSVKIDLKGKKIDDRFSFDKSSSKDIVRWSSWFKMKDSVNYNVHFLDLDLETDTLEYHVVNDLDISIDNRLEKLTSNNIWQILDNAKVNDNFNFILDNKVVQYFIFTCK